MNFEEELEGLIKGKKPSFKPAETVKPQFYKQEYGRSGIVEGQQYDFEFMAREEWGATKPLYEQVFPGLVADVVIGFTNTEECHDVFGCAALVKSLQKKHIDEGEPDIRYNFLIAGDGQVYEGRGWHVKPPPAPEWTEVPNCSLNIAYIVMKGHFPPKPLAKIAMQLIDFGCHNYCLQEYVGIVFDYFDEHHDVAAEMEKNPNYTADNDKDPENMDEPIEM